MSNLKTPKRLKDRTGGSLRDPKTGKNNNSDFSVLFETHILQGLKRYKRLKNNP